MGAKVAGKPAKSWMGVPLLARGEAIGAIILQDLETGTAFDKDDLRFQASVASQVSGAIHNVRLLNESQQTALQFETAAEIARDISSSLDLDEILAKSRGSDPIAFQLLSCLCVPQGSARRVRRHP